ncbi:hypothetical protein AX769_01100 [Frondihabitans sp. PAMC 28766]|uniref:T6SS immunity protein Tdi1 domain-containing protein n=1 Tax=Frondihabitans sp. PAMC 28766 TaxID=1795630 RepID=UPI00078E03CC|nr:T6SS immunity protein Tdi1 domain-containing protein [Frondihabitans sp. PAMC 28766]AMM18992.1 hypothetical protein AX769_01100 [Frondihabitans sp. PAMC 28766]
MLTPDADVFGDLTPWHPAPLGGVFADANYCGRSFDEGLLRFHNADTGAEGGELVRAAFGDDVALGTAFFAIDWRGRQYGAVPPSTPQADPLIVVADVGTGVLEPVAGLSDFIGFLNGDGAAATLGAGAYAEWRAANGTAGQDAEQLAFDECLSYIHPLFLGGTDDTANLERTDVSVHWTVLGQVFAKTRGLPEGTPIRSVGVDPES